MHLNFNKIEIENLFKKKKRHILRIEQKSLKPNNYIKIWKLLWIKRYKNRELSIFLSAKIDLIT